MLRRLLALLLLLGLAASPAAADDIAATARGVVRVVTIATVDGEVVGFGHGSGFAVAPNRVVTNAHVIELADKYPDNVVIGVVPSEGAKSYQAKIVSYDRQRDLALLEFTGAKLPPVALFTGPVNEGDRVVALGYPGNVDVATAQSADDYIKPLTPVRTEGGFSGARSLSGIHVLVHTANIARGNSGGPLLDPCGRVIGVNSAITNTQEGDSSFGFAIADSELAAFLHGANQSYATVNAPCTTMDQVLAQDQAADAQAHAAADTQARDAALRQATQHEEALAAARADQERARENVMAVAAVLLVLGALVLGGAGLLESRGARSAAIWTVSAGVLLLILAVIVFVERPEGAVTIKPGALPSVAETATPAPVPTGKMVCTLVPARSRITVSQSSDVTLDWNDGCMNGRTQYAEDGARWTRVLVPEDEQTVSVLQYDPTTQTYVDDRYLLGSSAMDSLRALKVKGDVKACTSDNAIRQKLGQQLQAIRAALPPRPDERLTYSCKPAGH